MAGVMVNGGAVGEDMESRSVFSCRLIFSEGRSGYSTFFTFLANTLK